MSGGGDVPELSFDGLLSIGAVDACDVEPIAYSGAIQPHGFLLGVDPITSRVTVASDNLAAFTSVTAEAALGADLAVVIGGDAATKVRGLLTLGHFRDVNPVPVTVTAPSAPDGGQPGSASFDMVAHWSAGLLVLEFEPVRDAAADLAAVQRSMRRVMGQPPDSDDATALCATAVGELRLLTGYDRVLAYRFDADAHGEVIAEARRPDQEPFLGLAYPAGDIPRQARLLYLTNRLRVIADVDYRPVPLRGVPGAGGVGEIDLGRSQLRSVSPVHLQYLRNMGVGATMTVSVVVDDHLWGMLACHHDSPKHLSYYLRLASETLGSMLAVQLRSYESRQERDRLTELGRLSGQVVTAMAASEHLAWGAGSVPRALIGMVGADGAVVQLDGQRVTAGQVPDATTVEAVRAGLARQGGTAPIVTDALPALLSAGAAREAADPVAAGIVPGVDAAGALYLPLDHRSGDFVLWLRGDRAQAVRWAGAPAGTGSGDPAGAHLTPRASFAEWLQVVRGRSRPWLRAEVTTAAEFAEAMPELLLHRAQNRLLQLALHDSLTGLPNRALLLDRLQALAGTASATTHTAVLFVDLDRFKSVNDTLGHEAGDTLLVDAARRLRGAVRPGDVVGRLGGDEFVIMLAGLGNTDEAFVVAQRVLRAFQSSFPLTADIHQIVTVSVGLAQATGPFDPAELLRQSDNALYSAKRAGRNQIAVFDKTPSELQSVVERTTTQELEVALADHQLVVHYQPIVSASAPWTGRPPPADWRGVEALVRWAHPQRGLLGPDHFIGLAEETGLIGALGEYVLDEVLRQLAAWQWPGLYAAVNVSARELRPGFAGRVLARLAAAGIPVDSLRLEVTETQVMDQPQAAAATLAELDAAGVRIAIDDFGTGFASLSHVRHFPASTLKIDRSFVSGLPDDPRDIALVSAAIQLAHSLGMTTIAEGVETPDQLASLELLGCDLAQGYLIGRPMPAADIDRLIDAATVTGSEPGRGTALAADLSTRVAGDC